jgi:glycosyltransferase involved in cell wall biosynthesis
MRILHIYPKADDMIAKHVSILVEGMQGSLKVQAADSFSSFKECFQQLKPDIVHGHGCWQGGVVSAANYAKKHGARFVLSPHGQLEPWELKTHRGTHIASYVERAFAIIAFGKMEQKYLARLKWNPRIEVIRNSLITNSITPQEMCSQTFAVYQKVLDSNVLELMDDSTLQALSAIIKAGITGDRRWVTDSVFQPSEVNYRQLLIYAEHQNIRNYVDYGINILGLNAPALDTTKITAFFPETYQTPKRLKDLIGEYKGDETDYLLRMIRQIQKQPLMLHLIELSRELRRDTVDEDRLYTALEDKGLLKYASRLMQVLSEETLLDEGYMPLPPTDDRGTRQIRNLIANHLKI